MEVFERGTYGVHAFCEPGSCSHVAPVPSAWQGSEAYLADPPGDTILVRLYCHT